MNVTEFIWRVPMSQLQADFDVSIWLAVSQLVLVELNTTT